MLPAVKNPSDHIHGVLKDIADTLDEERRQQFSAILGVLGMDDSNMEQTYYNTVCEMFGACH